MTEIHHILCPVDFSEPSAAALRYAIGLAEKLNVDVTVLNVYHVPAYAVPDGAILPTANWTASIMSASEGQLGKLITEYQTTTKVKLHPKLKEGSPHAEINRVAQEAGAELIVMGTHGRTGLPRLLLGSVAERVVRTSDVPVLTVRGE